MEIHRTINILKNIQTYINNALKLSIGFNKVLNIGILEDVVMGKSNFKVVIAGAGSSGLLLARNLAKSGIEVLVYERSEEGFHAHNWSDAVEFGALEKAGFEMPSLINGGYKGRLVKEQEIDDRLFESHRVNPLQILSPDLKYKTKTDVDFKYITTDRVSLNKILLKEAKDAGAKVFYNHTALKLIGDTDKDLKYIKIKGVSIRDNGTEEVFDVHADIVVDATGHISSLRTQFINSSSIGKKYTESDLAYAYRTVRKVNTDMLDKDSIPDHYRYGAYKGYFWTHFHRDDVIDVGGGVKCGPGRVEPEKIVDETISLHPAITSEEIRGGSGLVLVGKSPYSIAASGFLAVGDAAGQVVPTTGCGVGGGLIGAMLASDTIIECSKKGDSSIKYLWDYNWKWFADSRRGANLAALSALKEILIDLTHDDISFLIKKDILSGEMLTPSINGIFYTPNAGTMIKTLFRGIGKPSLLSALNKASNIGNKIYDHYLNYPKHWEKESFEKWESKSEEYFRSI